MALLNKLSDDCLLEVLERLPVKELFKIQQVNQRLNRVAASKLKGKFKTLSLKEADSCTHPKQDEINLNCPELKEESDFPILRQPSIQRILTVLARAGGIKSIYFGEVNLPDGFLLDVVRASQELECIHLKTAAVNEEEWDQVMDVMGYRMIHFARENFFTFDQPSEIRMIESLAAKCPNIKRVEWCIKFACLYLQDNQYVAPFNSEFVAAFKSLPKSCYVSFCCLQMDCPIEDGVFDKLYIQTLDWSFLDDRYDRLASLQFDHSRVNEIRCVDFNGLKRLRLINNFKPEDVSINCLIASRFSRLEEFYFNASGAFNEDNYKALFQQMPSLKKLTINWMIRNFNRQPIPHFPRSSIHQLKQLQIVEFSVTNFTQEGWQPKGFIELLEYYVDRVKSLKKLIVPTGYWNSEFNQQVDNTIKDELNRIRMKQNRVEVLTKA